MRLHSSPASPFGRKVKVAAIETGVFDRLEIVVQPVTPVSSNPTVNTFNPLGKIPCLELNDGTGLYDSRVISEYLDTLHEGARLFPASGEARWTALRLQALGDGLLDAALAARYEAALRPEPLRWTDWASGQRAKIARALDRLESDAAGFADRIDIGTITAACALGYLDFRFDAEPWRPSRPSLSGWFERFSLRPSMARTRPG